MVILYILQKATFPNSKLIRIIFFKQRQELTEYENVFHMNMFNRWKTRKIKLAEFQSQYIFLMDFILIFEIVWFVHFYVHVISSLHLFIPNKLLNVESRACFKTKFEQVKSRIKTIFEHYGSLNATWNAWYYVRNISSHLLLLGHNNLAALMLALVQASAYIVLI